MIWVPTIIYVVVLIISLVVLFVIDPDYGDYPGPCMFVWAWPVTYPYVIVNVACYWTARGIRWVGHDLWGAFK